MAREAKIKITPLQEYLIRDFYQTAKANGIHGFSLNLPRNHSLLTSGVRQIRGNRALAEGFDTLGNMIRLQMDMKVVQLFDGEF